MRFILALFFLAMTACASTQKAPPQQKAGGVEPIVIGESRHIESAHLGATRTYNVWLPPSYEQGDARYPVLYVIDGGLQQDFHHISGLAQLSTITGMFRDIIVVGVETVDRQSELTPPSSDPRDIAEFSTHGHVANFRAFLREEVMPDVAAHYRTSGENALIGESLAGLFIMETFLNEPDAADAYIAISPSLWWDKASLAESANAKLRAFPQAERKLYLALASEGGLMRSGVLDVVKALQKEKVSGLDWTFSDRPDLDHSTIYHREALEALLWVFPREKTPSGE
ncbi:alpha/beta hydrolase [Hyphococcus luteus]|uniref:Esterase n=1 Tax=Hyphococcus luteus TaxID=2058213 RepID=A0A2S7K4P6_9PROT|nr:alpha/beta hydrolase-fold protein [Marinicaulis flavus]PQA87480.1 esterase [Marinicaulis flavus]